MSFSCLVLDFSPCENSPTKYPVYAMVSAKNSRHFLKYTLKLEDVFECLFLYGPVLYTNSR